MMRAGATKGTGNARREEDTIELVADEGRCVVPTEDRGIGFANFEGKGEEEGNLLQGVRVKAIGGEKGRKAPVSLSNRCLYSRYQIT
jgi:hypothetical protein